MKQVFKLRSNEEESSTPSEEELEALAKQTGESVEALRIFAKISDPRHVSLFKADAARRAFKIKS